MVPSRRLLVKLLFFPFVSFLAFVGAQPLPKMPLQILWRWVAPTALSDLATGDLDGDGKDEVLACAVGGQVWAISNQGKVLKTLTLDRHVDLLHIADLDGDGKGEILGTGIWQHPVIAYDQKGKRLWKYNPPHNSGVDAIFPVDINGDGKREVLIGYNGATGFHVINAKGKLRWKTERYGNCWGVGFARLEGGRRLALICEGLGSVRGFNAEGDEILSIQTDAYLDFVVGADANGDGVDEIIALGVTFARKREEVAFSFNADGQERWRYPLRSERNTKSRKRIALVIFRKNERWLTIVAGDGKLHLLKVRTETPPAFVLEVREVVSSIVIAMGKPIVSVCPMRLNAKEQGLVVATEEEVFAYTLKR